MDIPLKPEFETKLNRIASETGRAAAQVVEELITGYFEHDEWFRSEVRKGLASLDRGEFISEDEVQQRIDRTLGPR